MRSALSAAKVTSLLGIFLAVSVLMGVIAAGLAAPVVGAAGLAAREGVGMFDRLPGDLEQNPLAQQSRILAADGSVLATPAKQNRIIAESDEISQHMKDAQVAIEDERFFDHGGMDVEALARAVVSNATTDNTQGGSTLTQQYIKMALQAEAIKEQDAEALQQLNSRSGLDGYIRKLRELKYAVTLEERLTKDEILVGYLNLAFYGDNVYGVEAAARHYFDVKAADLSIAQAATLAGIVRAPTTTNPVADPELATARRNTVLDKMLALEMISEEEWETARESELELTLTDSQRSCINSPNPYFCDYVTAWLLQQPALGATQDERLIATLAHASAFLPMMGVLAPLAIWITQKEKSPFVAFHALQALIYQAGVLLVVSAGMCCYLLSFAATFAGVLLSAPPSSPDGFDPLLSAFLPPLLVFGTILVTSVFLTGYALVGALMTAMGKPFRYLVIGSRVKRYLLSQHVEEGL